MKCMRVMRLSKGVLVLVLAVLTAVVLSGCKSPVGNNTTENSPETLPAGSLDPTFGTNGVVVYDSGSDDYGMSVTGDGNGRVLVTGYSGHGLNENMVIWRYTANGTADSTFDTDGMVVYDYISGTSNPNADRGASITIDTNGKILVAGWDFFTDQNLNSLLTWRYNSNGSLDTDFDPPNFLVNALFGGDRSIATDSSGKILETGYTTNIPAHMTLARYNTDSSYDSTFNSSGVLTYSAGNGDYGNSVTVDGNGRILVAGYSNNGSDDDMAIWRYNADGSLDTSFDTDGVAVYDGGIGADEEGRCMTTDAKGRILVTGFVNNGTDDDMSLWRYNTDGSPDTSFGVGGLVVYDSGRDDGGYSITTDAKGRILVAGYVNNGTDDDMSLWRYNADGSPDTSFDDDGMVLYDSGKIDQARSVAIDADGKILVTGYSSDGSNPDMVIWRYAP